MQTVPDTVAEEFFWLVTPSGDQRAIGGASLCVNGHAASFGYVLARAPWRARDTSRYALTRDEWKPSRRRDVRG